MVDRPDLDKLIAAAKQHKMTDAELAEQRASWVRGEMGMGETSVMKRQAIDLDELIKLHKTATEGRWNVQDFSPAMDSPKIARDVTISCSWPDHIGIASMNNGLTATLDEARANATFIAEIKNACDDGLLERLRTAERERDEADRRAGAAERNLEHLEDRQRKADAWMRERKDEVGVSENAPFDDAWKALASELAAIKAENERLRGLLWYAWNEFNAIRARSGAPLDQYGITTCDEAWWWQMTEAFASAIGEEARKPWPSAEALTALETTND